MQYKILPFTITMQFGDHQQTIHPTLLWNAHDIILVDCGFIGSLPLLEEQLQSHGLSSGQITALVLTHHDHDHMGAAATLKGINPNMRIYCSAEEATFVSADVKPLRLHQAEELQKRLPPDQQSFGRAFCEMLRRVEPVSVDRLLRDGERLDWCGGCRVIAPPGHTPGHISLVLDADSIIITGDAMALENGQPVIANPQFTLDMGQARASMEKLLAMNAKTWYCYHGGVYHPDLNPEGFEKCRASL